MESSLNKALWFMLRRDKISKDGKAPISMFYTLNNVRIRYNTDQRIDPVYWNKQAKEAHYIKKEIVKTLKTSFSDSDFLTKSQVDDINQRLLSLKGSVKTIENNFIALSKPFSAAMVIHKLKQQENYKSTELIKIEEPTGLLFSYIDQYIQDHVSIRVPGSLTVYKSVKNHLKAYEDDSGVKIRFENIDYSFFHKFQTFLINRKKINKDGTVTQMLNNTTIAKALSTLKTFLGYAQREGIKVKDAYKGFVIKREKLEVIALDQDEFDSILELDLTENKRLERTRDIFIFSCTTGLRYSDIAQLRREHITKTRISIKVKKTKADLIIPLNAISAAILDKYKDGNKPLPVFSSQNLNYAIKDLCKAAAIDKPVEIVRFSGVKRIAKVYPKYELIHIHTGRKTFASLSLEKGMSAEEVMKIGGWEDYRSFKKYVNITEKRKEVVMLKAWGAPGNKLSIA